MSHLRQRAREDREETRRFKKCEGEDRRIYRGGVSSAEVGARETGVARNDPLTEYDLLLRLPKDITNVQPLQRTITVVRIYLYRQFLCLLCVEVSDLLSHQISSIMLASPSKL